MAKKKIKKLRAKKREKISKRGLIAICYICGMDAKHAVGLMCTDCGLFCRTACHQVVDTSWKTDIACVNYAALQ